MADRDVKVLILGTGIAGLTAALKFAEHARVTVVSKAEPEEGATRYAQGGIASVWSKSDSFEEHVRDTHEAGAGLCHSDAVEACVHEGPARVRELIDWGVPFTQRSGNAGKSGSDPAETFDLHREGGHSQRRILHADDLTGLAIERTLLERARAHPSVEILEHHVAIDLITEGKILRRRKKAGGRCLGAYVLDSRAGKVRTIASDLTLLATGGAGKAYLYTSNPDTATGDGVAMAYRAGARVANLEFFQFHPTCLYHPEAKNSLITEALRGEGAILRTRGGEDFMPRYDSRGSLAPRDIVARAIDSEMKRLGDRHVWLDATGLPAAELLEKFPNIAKTCAGFGIDITRDLIPVVPAAHYMCGGVLVDLNGQTTVEGLYAVGEVACTGLHGANRLASNSLLEAVVYAHRVVGHALPRLRARPASGGPGAALGTAPSADAGVPAGALPDWDIGHAVPLEEQIDIAANWMEVRSTMWNYVGIVRSSSRLERAKRRLEMIREEVDHAYWRYLPSKDLVELRNLVLVAQLIVQCASLRKESRGLHFTVDYPERNDRLYARDTLI
ncbi:MAG: L-aspartate oxidase [Bdellovibrionales bacterium]|nr:L-aspartate oxidase [Bdellovibrionales bacterium]